MPTTRSTAPARRRLKQLLVSVLTALLLGACGSQEPPATPTPIILIATATPTPPATATPLPTMMPSATPVPLSERLKRATVMVRVYRSDQPDESALIGTGSGFLARINDKLVVVTAAHVVAGATSMTVVQGGSTRERPVWLRGSDDCLDLAVLELNDLSGIEPLEFGRSADLSLGALIRVAGFPFGGTPGTQMTLTSGEVSLDGRTDLEHWQNLAQYTAPTNPGASGAAVVNSAGQVVAIHVAGRGEGMNYGVAIDDALPTLEALVDGTRRAWLGIATRDMRNDNTEAGLMVSEVDPSSPLGKAGVRRGDVMTRLGEEPINEYADLCRVLRAHRDGTTPPIQLLRAEGGAWNELAGSVTLSQPDGENRVAPVSAVQILDLSPAGVGEFQALLATARQGLTLGRFETFDNSNTKFHFVEAGPTAFAGGVYQLTLTDAARLVPALWQQTDRPNLRESRPRQLGERYLIEADVAFASFDSTSGVGLFVDVQPNRNGIVFLINRDNTFQIITLIDGKVSAEHSSQRIPWPAMQGGVNQLRVFRNAEAMSFWINNTVVAYMADQPFQGGGVGVMGWGGTDLNGTARVLVDNVRIELP